MPTERFPKDAVRRSLDELPDTMAMVTTEEPSLQELFVVPGHERALDLDSTVVVGDRGTGKSFWSAALNGSLTRSLIAAQLPRLKFDGVETSWGFSVSTKNQDHPSRRVLQRLHETFETENIWRAVVLHRLTAQHTKPLPGDTWEERVGYVAADSEREESILDDISTYLQGKGKRHLIIFDALDRTGSSWQVIRSLVRGLLQVCLDFQGVPGIQVKLFMRPDMLEDRKIWQFPDSSKLMHGCVNLEWRRADLYGLFFHWLSNHRDSGSPFRDWFKQKYRFSFEPMQVQENHVAYPVPGELKQDEKLQQEVLRDMATPYMGTNPRRGRTYTWLPNHLADAKGQVSPRSFLIAIREAQRNTRFREHPEVLHWDGIKKGVQGASRIRVEELGEDYPWIRKVLDSMKGLTVPCKDEDIKAKWVQDDVVGSINKQTVTSEEDQRQSDSDEEDDRWFLPPHAMDALGSDSPEQNLISELQRIGVIRRTSDKRVDIPDLFRVAAAIGRRGGVRPIR